jgi:outer membrane biosynthesis protein TonB
MSPFYITLPPMLHAELSPLAAGLPPSILAAAAGRAARLAGISVTDLLEVDAAHEKADIITATLEKVQAQYAKKKAASRDRRSAARKVGSAPAEPSVAVLSVGEPVAVASAAMGISQISIVGAEPEPLPPPPPTPSPPPSPPAKAPPRPSRAVSKKPPPAQDEESEEEESEEEESEEEESEDEESEEEPPSPPARVLSRALSRPAAAPKKAAGNATRARWGL